MKKLAVPVLGALVAVLCVAVVLQASNTMRLQRELAQIRTDLDRLEGRPGTKVVQRRDSEDPGEYGEDPLSPSERREVDETEAAPLQPGVKGELDALRKKVAALEEKSKPRNPRPPLKDLAKKLKLDAGTEQRMAMAMNESKDSVFALFKLTRSDGGNFVDDFVAALQSENRDEVAKQVWTRLMSEKLPGLEETFVQRYESIRDTLNRSLGEMLTEQQRTAYQGMRLDPLKVETGHDPWNDYFRSHGVEWPWK